MDWGIKDFKMDLILKNKFINNLKPKEKVNQHRITFKKKKKINHKLYSDEKMENVSKLILP